MSSSSTAATPIGSVPSSWSVTPLQAVVRPLGKKNAGMAESNLLSLSYGSIIRKDIDTLEGLLPESFEGYQIVEKNDLVFRFTDLQNDQRSLRSGLVPERGIITSAYLAVRPVRIDPSYFAYLMRAYDNEKVFYSFGGGVRQSLKFDDVKRLPIPVPPDDEQRRIAQFLDRETAQIDELIAKQEQLISTLAERVGTQIREAVTGGFYSASELVPSGADWFSDRPRHWSSQRLGRLGSVTLGKMLQTSSESVGELRPYVRAGNIQEYGLDLTEVKYMPFTAAEARKLDLRAGDLLVVEGGAGYGRSDVVREDLPSWGFQNHVIRVRPNERCDVRFLDYVVKAIRSSGHFEAMSAFATIPNVSAEKLAALRVPVPPVDEQVRLADDLDRSGRDVRRLTEHAVKTVDLLRERRQALISAAVTGQIDVGGAS